MELLLLSSNSEDGWSIAVKKKIISIYKQNKELINYVVVGGMTTVVSLGVYYGLVWTILDPLSAVQLQLANIFSWVAAVTFAYFANRKYVFESTNSGLFLEAVKFYISRVSTLLLDMVIMFIGVTLLSFNDKIVKIAVQIIVMITNYVFSKLFVFTKENR